MKINLPSYVLYSCEKHQRDQIRYSEKRGYFAIVRVYRSVNPAIPKYPNWYGSQPASAEHNTVKKNARNR